MKESLYGLLDLQDVDNEVDELKRHKSEYPNRIAELEGLISEIREGRSAKEQELSDQDSAAHHFAQQLETAQENQKKHQTRMLDIKTNREYDALQQEMVAIQHAIDEYTEEQKRASEEVERIRAELEEQKEAAEQQLGQFQEEIDDLRGKVASIDAEVANILERRKKVAAAVPQRIGSIYDRVRRGKKKAIVRVVRDACSGCWTSLPPQKINELRIANRIIVCDGCGRILVWDDRKNGDG